ncbi:MAG: transcriptional repressor [Clostridia bacterium]|nr:transcriptional repressor [Clostridia bacterium]
MQKEIVATTLKTMHNHPTADAVYETVHLTYPSISKATVYRILNQMAQDGTALKVSVPDAADRFDDTCDPHYHIRCTTCGRVEDLMIPLYDLPNIPRENACGFRVTGCSLLFRGLCPSCEAEASE